MKILRIDRQKKPNHFCVGAPPNHSISVKREDAIYLFFQTMQLLPDMKVIN